MDRKQLKDEWTQAMAALMELDKEKRDHFALLLLHLSKCYIKDNEYRAVVLVDTGDALLTFSSGANEMEAAEMVSHANEVMNIVVTSDAPPKEMFN